MMQQQRNELALSTSPEHNTISDTGATRVCCATNLALLLQELYISIYPY